MLRVHVFREEMCSSGRIINPYLFHQLRLPLRGSPHNLQLLQGFSGYVHLLPRYPDTSNHWDVRPGVQAGSRASQRSSSSWGPELRREEQDGYAVIEKINSGRESASNFAEKWDYEEFRLNDVRCKSTD